MKLLDNLNRAHHRYQEALRKMTAAGQDASAALDAYQAAYEAFRAELRGHVPASALATGPQTAEAFDHSMSVNNERS